MTQIASHTPGPWEVVDNFGVCPVNEPDVEMVGPCYLAVAQGKYFPPSVQKANARLIAAAPDLLQIAELIEAAYSEGPARTFHTRLNELAGGISGSFAELLVHALDKARARS